MSDAHAHALLAAAAQAALADMAEEFAPLLQQELARLAAARAAWRGGAGAGALRASAHDLQGLGAIYGAPLAGRVAASLAWLLAASPSPTPALVDAHVDAIGALVREGAAKADPRGLALADLLERASARPLAQAA